MIILPYFTRKIYGYIPQKTLGVFPLKLMISVNFTIAQFNRFLLMLFKKVKVPRAMRRGGPSYEIYLTELPFSFWMTSCAPPSTMEVADTSVSTAFSCSSGMVSAPQLHMVDLTLARDIATLSFRLPA